MKNDDMLISYSLDTSTSVSIKSKTDKTRVESGYVDKDVDDQNMKEFLYNIDVYYHQIFTKNFV